MRKNITLIIAIALPLLMVLFIIGSVYIPRMFVNPQYSFVYSTDGYYYNSYEIRVQYSVTDGKLTEKALPSRLDYNGKPILENRPEVKFFFYDIVKDSAREISFEEAQKFTLNPESRSPDGYILDTSYGNDGIFELFGSRSSNNGWYISKGMGSKKLTMMTSYGNNYYSYDQFRFLGWVIK